MFFLRDAPEPSSKELNGISGALSQPVIALINKKSGVVAYLWENRLTSLVTNHSLSISHFNEALRENNNAALIFNPVALAADTSPALQQVRELPIFKFVAPEKKKKKKRLSVARMSLCRFSHSRVVREEVLCFSHILVRCQPRGD